MGLNSKTMLYLLCTVIAVGLLLLTLVPSVAALLGALLATVQYIILILALLFAGAILLSGLASLLASFK